MGVKLNTETPTVFMIDDDEDVLDYIKTLLVSMGFQVSTFTTAQQFLNQHQPNQLGCLISDVMMPDITGLELQDILIERGIHIPLILISGHGNIAMAKNSLKKGAMDFIEKPVNAIELVNSVQAAIERDAKLRKKYQEIDLIKSRLACLTPREREILDCLVAGDSNKHMAKNMNISLRTVEAHRNNILQKMHAHSLADLIRLLLAAPRV